MMLTLALLLAAAPDASDLAATLSGAREVLESGEPQVATPSLLLDEDDRTVFEAAYQHQQLVRVVVELPRASMVAELELVGDAADEASTPAEVQVHGSAHSDGPWKPLATVKLGPAPARVKAAAVPARYLRLSAKPRDPKATAVRLASFRAFGVPVAAKADFTGAWAIDGGELRLWQQGARVHGCWLQDGSKGVAVVAGVAQGPWLHARWDDGKGRHGELAAALAEKHALRGVVGNHLEDSHQRLDGEKLTHPAVRCEAPEVVAKATLRAEGRVTLGGLVFEPGARAANAAVVAALPVVALEVSGGADAEAVARGWLGPDAGTVEVRAGAASPLSRETVPGRLAERRVVAVGAK